MKNFLFFLLAFGMFTFAACGDDDSDDMQSDSETDYQIHFITPVPADDANFPTTSMQGQTLALDIEVEDLKAGTVHHVNVKIYKKDDPTVILFDGPTNAAGEKEYHVHETDGMYEFKYNLELDPANVAGHTDWIVEVKAWGHEDGAGEVTATSQFHVHPM